MVFTALVLLVLHKVEITVKAVEGVLEEESDKAVSPGICTEHVEHS